MRMTIGLAASAALALALNGGLANAQVSLDPAKQLGIADILSWTGEKQATGYRDIEHIYKTTRSSAARPSIACM